MPPPPQDSLSLAQLRRIVADFPRTADPLAYAYHYADTSPLPEEIDEWFMYNFWQWVRLNAAHRAFLAAWERVFPLEGGWEEAGEEKRGVFVEGLLEGVKIGGDRIRRAEAVGGLVYLVLGRWSETVKKVGVLSAKVLEGEARCAATGVQLEAMREGVRMVAARGGLTVVWEVLRGVFESFW